MPTLPLEVVYQIIEDAWCSKMSPGERKNLVSSLILVNAQWLAVFLYIFGADVHIFDREFMDFYFQLLQGNSTLVRIAEPTHPLNDLCRKLTIHVTNPQLSSSAPSSEPECEKLVSDFFYTLKTLNALPNLRTAHIHFQNVPCEDLFQYNRLAHFPLQVESLELEYTFTGMIPQWMIPIPQVFAEPGKDQINWTLPSLRHLRVIGGFDDLMKMVFACPRIDTFEMQGCIYWDRATKRDVRDDNLVRTLFFRDIPERYAESRPQQVEGRPLQKLFVFTDEPEKGHDGSLTYLWWLSHDFSPEDIMDHENVQYISCNLENAPPRPGAPVRKVTSVV